MRNILLIFAFMFSFQMYGQKEDFWKEIQISQKDFFKETQMRQKKSFKEAEKLLKKSKEVEAIYKFHYVYRCNGLNKEYEKIAKKRIDSLLPIVQRKQIQKAKGKWKLKFLTKEFLSYKPTYEYIEITDDKIIFFEQNSDIPSRVESIVLTPYDNNPYNNGRNFPAVSLTFENSEIWEFLTGKKKKEKRLYPRIKRFSDGTGQEWIDEIGIIIDRKERKKAYAEERRTYYLLVKE